MDELLELLKSWMDEHRRSPLDATFSCKTCAALVLNENEQRHQTWHEAQERQANATAAEWLRKIRQD